MTQVQLPHSERRSVDICVFGREQYEAENMFWFSWGNQEAVQRKVLELRNNVGENLRHVDILRLDL